MYSNGIREDDAVKGITQSQNEVENEIYEKSIQIDLLRIVSRNIDVTKKVSFDVGISSM
jgi:hypothetical protein